MNTYDFYLTAPGGARSALPALTLECACDAEALEAACGILGRMRDRSSVEVWVEGRRILSLGGQDPEGAYANGFIGRRRAGAR